MAPCLAPVILAGYLLTIQTSWHHTTNFDGPMLEAQTGETGAALNLRVAASGVSSLGVQYGWQMARGEWSLTLQPLVGVGLIDRHIRELSSEVNFSLGAQVMAGYESYRLSFGYWHVSNAGLGSKDGGLDLLALQTGFSFH